MRIPFFVCQSVSFMAESDNLVWTCSICHEEPMRDAPLVYCENCGIAVHQQCYGYPLLKSIPEEDWFCDYCTANASSGCVLCPQSGGVLKRTTDARWVHLLCAMWLPEAFFRVPEGSDAIDVLHIPESRFNETCFICKEPRGACMTCSDSECNAAFHVTCALKRGIKFKYETCRSGADIVFATCNRHRKR